MKSSTRLLWMLGMVLFCFGALAAAPPNVAIPVPPAAQPSAHFDPEAATNAYLALIPPSASSRSDAYFEGGYWLLLWDFLYGAAIALLILNRFAAFAIGAASALALIRMSLAGH